MDILGCDNGRRSIFNHHVDIKPRLVGTLGLVGNQVLWESSGGFFVETGPPLTGRGKEFPNCREVKEKEETHGSWL